MAKFAFLSSTPLLTEQIRQKMPPASFSLEFLQVNLGSEESVIHTARSALAAGADGIITRGLQAYILRHHAIDVPIIEMHLTPYDLILLILKAIQETSQPNMRFAIICMQPVNSDTYFLCEKLGLSVRVYPVKCLRDYYIAADLAIDEGAQYVISSLPIIEYVRERGLPTAMLMPSSSSIQRAFEIADKVAFAIDIEKAKSAELDAVFNYSFDAILTIDNRERVISLNLVAQRMFDIASIEAHGRPLSEIIPEVDHSLVEQVLVNKERLYGRLLIYRGIAYVFNFAPILIGNEEHGAILSLQEYKKIEASEADVRKQVYLKGHVAKYCFDDIIGKSPSILQVKRIARQYAEHNSTVLIEGESGTGKEMFAQSIHNASLRKNAPFVTVNCAAIPENLIESELFGYVDGAFTGALKKGKRGLFDLAHTGTIFLDEISELNIYSQQKFLRVLQERCICKVGDDKVIPVDVRVIAATNKNLFALVSQGKFREDLFYRLNVLSLTLPPLRERQKDVIFLFWHYIHRFESEFKKTITITDGALQVLANYAWPGNIRQLRNFCERLAIVSDGQPVEAGDVCSLFPRGETNRAAVQPAFRDAGEETKELPEEARKIIEQLESCGGNREEAARRMGISKTTLWRKIKKYNIRGKFTV